MDELKELLEINREKHKTASDALNTQMRWNFGLFKRIIETYEEVLEAEQKIAILEVKIKCRDEKCEEDE